MRSTGLLVIEIRAARLLVRCLSKVWPGEALICPTIFGLPRRCYSWRTGIFAGTLEGRRLWLLFFGEYESPEGIQHRDRGREKKSAKKACVERRQICELDIRTMPDKESPSVLEFIAFVLVSLLYAFKTQSLLICAELELMRNCAGNSNGPRHKLTFKYLSTTTIGDGNSPVCTGVWPLDVVGGGPSDTLARLQISMALGARERVANKMREISLQYHSATYINNYYRLCDELLDVDHGPRSPQS
ncbi:hypothetical protein DFH08DRAFT_817900 [Mycena albidolilacea]|uniref:Uncharacterized protein n=1 Tax=Mycena albidolilacea TaxID=1033008 RepID=A0AAD7EGS2_9AGAR|nr:hypothetical protein DFH08DRAFT_817900 [Mycena albidolilacea]